MKRTRVSELARLVEARRNCIKSNNLEWQDRHEDRIKELTRDLPHGSGFDAGTELILDESTGNKLVFETSFHHMDEFGGYDGWTVHTVTSTPSFVHGVDLHISGKDRNSIKEMMYEMFDRILSEEVEIGE